MPPQNWNEQGSEYGLSKLQKLAMSIMSILAIVTFVGANLQAFLWQSSDWLVSTVLPAVVVQLTNEERADNSAQPLQRNATLDAAAKLKAEHMAKNEYFAHFSPDGVSPWYWFDEAGYVYAHAGENLAIHFTDSSEVVEAWMKSPTHRQNIVNSLYTEIGVGTAKGKYEGYDTVYVVQLFGAPAILPIASKPVEPVNPVVAVVDTKVREVFVEEVEILPSAVDESALLNQSENTEVETTLVTPPITTEEFVELNEIPLPQPIFSEIKDTVLEPNQTDSDAITINNKVLILESPTIATSSGLAVAQITTQNNASAGATAASIATQPNLLLQSIYMVLGVLVLVLLSISIVLEARRFHYMQVAYGFMLLFGMGGLWFVHTLLTTGAVIV